jgi:hypothetical protein
VNRISWPKPNGPILLLPTPKGKSDPRAGLHPGSAGSAAVHRRNAGFPTCVSRDFQPHTHQNFPTCWNGRATRRLAVGAYSRLATLRYNPVGEWRRNGRRDRNCRTNGFGQIPRVSSAGLGPKSPPGSDDSGHLSQFRERSCGPAHRDDDLVNQLAASGPTQAPPGFSPDAGRPAASTNPSLASMMSDFP